MKIGDKVIYIPTNETGIVTSKNSTYIFVRFTFDIHSKACLEENLIKEYKEK